MSDPEMTVPVLHFPRDLEPVDYLMLRAETDPRARTSGLTVAMLDKAPDLARLRATWDRASRVVVRLRQHVVVPALPLGPPQWVTDPDFDLDYHVRRIRLPEPGTMRDLLDFAATFLSAPLDLARPLWEALLVEGVSEGDAPAALLIKMHHAVSDGMGAVELFRQLYDFERDAARGPMPTIPSPEDLTATDLARKAVRRLPITTIRTASRRAARNVRLGRQFFEQPAKAMQDAGRLMASAQRILGPSSVPPSPLLRGRSLGRRLETLEFPLDDFRRAGRAAGGSLNDAFIAALCGALRRYHEAQGVPVNALPFALPVSLRTDDDPVGGNRFAGAFIPAPVGEADPARRIRRIRELVLTARSEPAINILSAIAPIVSRLPMPLLAALASGAGGIDVQASNVPGYPQTSYIAGARITKLLPFGPLPGVPMMIVLITQAGMCYVGAHYDTAAVRDGELFTKSLHAGFDEVLALAPAEVPKTAKRSAPPKGSARTKAGVR